jgi:hypothetical protein
MADQIGFRWYRADLGFKFGDIRTISFQTDRVNINMLNPFRIGRCDRRSKPTIR